MPANTVPKIEAHNHWPNLLKKCRSVGARCRVKSGDGLLKVQSEILMGIR
jgi:hypothetical protein